MPLRCLLFASDEATAQPLWHVITELGMEGEHCRQAVEAVERLTNHPFHIVIADWDDEPEASFLLKTARELKAAHRPLTLAIVKNDATVPKALQAGANSVLRKPIVPTQVRDTLSTARDLLRAKLEPAAPKVQAAAASATSTATPPAPAPDKAFRAGEFLQPAAPRPSAQFDTESEIASSLQPSSTGEVTRLTELEPMAAAVARVEAPAEVPLPPQRESVAAPSPATRLRTLPPIALPATPAVPQNDLLSYNETSHPEQASAQGEHSPSQRSHPEPPSQEQRNLEEDLAFADTEPEEAAEPVRTKSGFRFRKPLLIAALALTCGVAYVKVPRSLWKQNVQVLYTFVAHSGRDILHPKTVTPAQAPAAHDDFTQAGDEYKLPVVENIPDATTDPSQIHVLPVVDPTIKPANGSQGSAGQNPADSSGVITGSGAADNSVPTAVDSVGQNSGQGSQPSGPTDPGNSTATGQNQPAIQVQEGQPRPQNPPANLPPTVQSGNGSGNSLPAALPAPQPQRTSTNQNFPAPYSQAQTPVVQNHHQVRPATAGAAPGIPGSLKSQIASTTPEASGTKPMDAALPSIGPVDISEATARSLLAQQVDPAYPESARVSRQQGTVVLQVMIARDGSVEDAKFLQGSLVFARAAIDAVKQWRFKPYSMNGRPAAARTTLTVSFKPTP